MPNLPLISFNTGEVSSLIDVRFDVAKYESACRILENFIPRIYGPVERRPGTKYVSTAKNSPEGIRLIPFIYSSTIAYMCEFGDLYARFFFDGGEVHATDGGSIDITTPYLVADLPQLQIKQSADVMWTVHPSYQPRKLSRTSATEFSLDTITFDKGPFIERNDIAKDDDVAIFATGYAINGINPGGAGTGYFQFASIIDLTDLFPANKRFYIDDSSNNDKAFTVHESTVTTWAADTMKIYANETIGAVADGKLMVAGGAVTLTASSATFTMGAAGHTGSLFKLTHKRRQTVTEGNKTGTNTGVIGEPIDVKGKWTFNTHGNWDATVAIQRMEDGTNWETFRTYISVITNSSGSRNVQKSDLETADNVQYRIKVTEHSSGTINADFTVHESTQDSIFRITELASTEVASATSIVAAPEIVATKRWAEGSWSHVRGWPTAFTFFGERAVYAGTAKDPSTIWFSKVGKFENFEAGVNDADSFALTLNTANSIRWLASLDALLIGTSGDEWRIRATSVDKALTPTNFDIRQQTSMTGADIQAIEVNEAILFVDFVGRKMRELTFSDAKQKFVSPDLTALAEHITKSGIVSVAYQRHPDSIVWVTLNDGTLLSMTYEREQDVVAWARHPMGITQEAVVATTTGVYPTLRELTESEIPEKPVAPANGVQSSVTTITTAQGLQDMDNDVTADYILGNHIDLEDFTWTPIVDFSGIFEGSGFTISNLTIDAALLDNQALFGSLDDGAEIRNVKINNATIVGDDYVGVLVGRVDKKSDIKLKNIRISNSSITGDIYVGQLIGGFATDGNCNVFGCSATDCTVTGISTGYYTGGLVGYYLIESSSTMNDTFVDCFTTGEIIAGGSDSVGGLFGWLNGRAGVEVIIHTCYSTASIACSKNDPANIGGLIGYLVWSDVTSCHATGGITIAESDSENIGGFIGFAVRTNTIIDCYATGSIATKDATVIGGFCGKFDTRESTITRCYSTGSIDIENGVGVVHNIGGFSGLLDGVVVSPNNGLVERCWSTGDITIENGGHESADTPGVGGFNGGFTRYSPVVRNCYSWGSILTEDGSSDTYGGFFGALKASDIDSDVTVTNCYSAQTDIAEGSGLTNQITQDSGTEGGFLGNDKNVGYDVNATACFWDAETSGLTVDASAGAAWHNTDWMQTNSNYDAAGWDMDDIWILEEVTTYKQVENLGTVGNVAVIPGSSEDEVWITVSRNIDGTDVRFIEQLQPRDWGSDDDDAFFVDCGLTYDGVATNTFTNLGHLEGEAVVILGDGAVIAGGTISNSSITIAEKVSKAHIGLPFRYKLKPMRLDITTPAGTTHGSIKVIPELVISFIKSLNVKYGDDTNTYDIEWRTTEDYDGPPNLFTGDITVAKDGGFSTDDSIVISGSDPLPCTIRAIIPRTEVTGR